MNPNDPAYPTDRKLISETGSEILDNDKPGLTKREYIAIQAMQGLLANPQRSHLDAAELSAVAVSYADALITALQEEEG